jgi:signal transduction histidine kinase
MVYSLSRTWQFTTLIMAAKSPPRSLLEYGLPSFAFLFLALYSYALVFEIPYIGLDFNPGDGRVTGIFSEVSSSQKIQLGDRLLQVGAVTWEAYSQDKRQPLFGDVQPGDVVSLLLLHEDRENNVLWVIPGPGLAEILDRISTLWLPYLFWVAGTATLYVVRPKDMRWRLLVAFNYLTAIWLMTGLVSIGAVWQSAIVMRALVGLCLPVYLHLHWEFPRPLGHIPAPLLWSCYFVGVVLAGLEWFQLMPPKTYLYVFAFALGGSLMLLIAHARYQPDQRQYLRVLAIAAGIIILPTLVIGTGVAGLLNSPLWLGWGALLSLPALPGAYFYVIYRRQLGGLELRVNRIITLYIFLILLFIVATLVFVFANVWIDDRSLLIALEVVLVIVAGLTIATTYPTIQRWIEQYVLGMPLPQTDLPETYSSRITTSLNMDSLISLLRDEIVPSLLIRQSALIWLKEDNAFIPIYTHGILESQLPTEASIPRLMAASGKYRIPSTANRDQDPLPWIRLILPMRVGEKTIGFWLLGSRDPDDWYGQRDILAVQSIANQTAIALVNIAQAERLRGLYRANIDRQELERARLARGIHDTVLNHLALLATSADNLKTSRGFDESYQKIVAYLREVIHNLRPAMLTYGLRPALEELVDELLERTDDSIEILLDFQGSEARYDSQVEQHLFRILQQACENAIQHAQAKTILIRGELEQEHLSISVTDDGVGFAGNSLTLDHLLIQRHYGLVGMYERAALIGAELKIDSAPGVGTQVNVNWNSDNN